MIGEKTLIITQKRIVQKTVEGHLTKALRILRDKLKEKFQILVLILGHPG